MARQEGRDSEKCRVWLPVAAAGGVAEALWGLALISRKMSLDSVGVEERMGGQGMSCGPRK